MTTDQYFKTNHTHYDCSEFSMLLALYWAYSVPNVLFDMEIVSLSGPLLVFVKGVLSMKLNCIWWWGSSSGDLVSVEYLFIAISSVMFWPVDPAKNAIQGNAPEGGHILVAVMRGNRVGGNWLMKWDEVKKIPLYSHRLTHRKRVTSELDDSYFRSMTNTQARYRK